MTGNKTAQSPWKQLVYLSTCGTLNFMTRSSNFYYQTFGFKPVIKLKSGGPAPIPCVLRCTVQNFHSKRGNLKCFWYAKLVVL